MSVKVPEFVLTEEYHLRVDTIGDPMILPQGSFVKPINNNYISKETRKKPINSWHNDNTDVFCFTRFGVVSLPKKIVREL